jgi:hypothetical protein
VDVEPPVGGEGTAPTPDVVTAIVPLSLLRFASFDEATARLMLVEPTSFGVRLRSIWRASPEESVPNVHVAVPAPKLQVPSLEVTDWMASAVGSVAVTLTSFDASSPNACTRNDVTKLVPSVACTEAFDTTIAASGGT